MSFRLRITILCGLIAALTAALVLGIVFSPDRVQARTEGRMLLPLASAGEVTGIDIYDGATLRVSLQRQAGTWQVANGATPYPGSATRIGLFLRMVAGLSRGTPVTSDAGHFAELGVTGDGARKLVLHRGADRPDIGMTVGRRAPSGDEDYVLLDGEKTVSQVRGSLAFYLGQETSYWYELHVLPDDVQGETIASVSVTGRLALEGGVIEGPYTLLRSGGGQQAVTWSIAGETRPVNRVVAGSMVASLALLEGVDFGPREVVAGAAVGSKDAAGAAGGEPHVAGAAGGGSAAGSAGGLHCAVTTTAGKTYSIDLRPGTTPGTVSVTTSWSPWTYVVNAAPLRRAILPKSALLGAQ